MHSAAFLAQENSNLYKANARQTRKRQLKRYFISTEIALQAQQAQQLVNQMGNTGWTEPATKQIRLYINVANVMSKVTQKDNVLILL
jgi:hypothetical protein